MKFQTNDQEDIRWLHNPEEFEVGDVVKKIKDAGKWDQLLELEQDEEGVVDCDSLYDYLRHEAPAALLSVGLHCTEATATVSEVIVAWAKAHADEGLKVSYCDYGETPSGLQLYNYGKLLGGISLEFEIVDADGKIDEVSLDSDEVFELVKDKANGNATTGAWDCTDVGAAEFEMWRERE